MRKPQPRMPQDGGGYRPAQGQLDPHGRPTPQPRPAADEDHLEIPAFLRRQAN
jgi:cell division protein FtsZ